MRKRYCRAAPRGSCKVETYLHMTPAGVKSFMKKRGLLDQSVHDELRTSTKNTIKLHRGYIGIKFVNFNQRTKRMYVISSWESPKAYHNRCYNMRH